jgi:hypothetical protein
MKSAGPERRAKPGAMKSLCLVPAVGCVLVYLLYPMTLQRLDLVDAFERVLGASWSATQIVEHADTLLLVAGIVLSAACWFTAECRERSSRS